ncbi:hypothetical protein SB5439_04999 [Klebsiella variicola]|uniref:hypothetical protein n=1 Tax=Klebsiella variicola TaxID=244366 RepID=UPI00109C57D2|nr:hypothetical protein [Klebsiella variicola]VGQ11821.1 hypothetical protein SB5439_04999 [Klebsiella variicola]
MAKVFYVTPFKEGDIGGGINESIALLPRDAWVCIRDADTLFLTGNAQRQIQAIVDANPEFELIGCKTNRLRSRYVTHDRDRLFECGDISTHVEVATQLETEHWAKVSPLPFMEVVAGMFMLMRVELWHKFPFPEKTPFFDKLYSRYVLTQGGKLGIADGIYLFHLYRWGKEDPCNYVEHLQNN